MQKEKKAYIMIAWRDGTFNIDFLRLTMSYSTVRMVFYCYQLKGEERARILYIKIWYIIEATLLGGSSKDIRTGRERKKMYIRKREREKK
jgi:hypothetical protein